MLFSRMLFTLSTSKLLIQNKIIDATEKIKNPSEVSKQAYQYMRKKGPKNLIKHCL
jgi:5-bromo-4-chloroindolyl phosphate hydrolysis protein